LAVDPRQFQNGKLCPTPPVFCKECVSPLLQGSTKRAKIKECGSD
jgi:hypothetical protein